MLAPQKETYDKSRQHIKKQGHYFANKGHLVKAMVFPVVMYGCESWPMKKAECQRINASELGSWRRLLRDLWTARRSNKSLLKQIRPEHSLQRLMPKLQYFGHLLRRTDSLEKNLMLGRQEEKGMTEDETGGWHPRLDGHEFEQAPGLGDEQGSLVCCSPWGHKESDTT